jgi:tetratricopeptide (TPR) repeat protein
VKQGRVAYEHGDYAGAAERFSNPMWRGVALYRVGRYDDAIDAFARVDSAESYFDQGNALAKLGKLSAAVAAYQEALKRNPGLAPQRPISIWCRNSFLERRRMTRRRKIRTKNPMK